MSKIIDDEAAKATIDDLCDRAAKRLIDRPGNPREYRIDLYREVRLPGHGRPAFVRIKITIPFF